MKNHSSKFNTLPLLAFAFSFLGCAEPKYLRNEIVQKNDNQKPIVSCNLNSFLPTGNCQHRLPTSEICVAMNVQICPDLESSRYGVLQLRFYRPNLLDQSAVPIELATSPKVFLWMPSMGHGSSPMTITKKDIGSYLLEDVFFIMSGRWEIVIQNGSASQQEEIRIPVEI